MKYFTDDYLSFFRELSTNNHKEWFHAQKKRYETSIKKPFEVFVNDLIGEIRKHDPSLAVEAKDCILRINRDIRFSKDKSPYNLHCTAFISNGGRKDKSIPGIFIRLSTEMIGIMGGCFGPSKEQLTSIRTSISDDVKGFRKLIEDSSFFEKFGEIKGEEIKRIPKEWQEAHQQEPLIAKKQFYFMAEQKPELITSDQLKETIMNYWHVARPVNEYLLKAIN